MKKPTTRRHHYLPQSYLAAFTDTGTKEGQFFVLEVHSGLSFRTSPTNVGLERDFNRIDIEGRSPDAIEQALAPFERSAAQAIRNVIKREEFPNVEDCNRILNLLGLMAVRNPYLRKSFNRFREEVQHKVFDILVSDKRIYDHYLCKVRESGDLIEGDGLFDDIKRLVQERRYRINFLPQGNLRAEFRTFDRLLPLLGKRTWSLLVAPVDGPEFICSDHPVTLVYKDGRGGPIGYGLKETEVFFPLGRRVGFYGVFETPLPPEVKLEPGSVAMINQRMLWSADRHIFSTSQSFAMWHEGQVREVHCRTSRTQKRDTS